VREKKSGPKIKNRMGREKTAGRTPEKFLQKGARIKRRDAGQIGSREGAGKIRKLAGGGLCSSLAGAQY